MKPIIRRIPYNLKRGENYQEFMIKEKDYGELMIYDIFFEDQFLFTMSIDGTVWLGNWEAVENEPVSLNKKSLHEICNFIRSINP